MRKMTISAIAAGIGMLCLTTLAEEKLYSNSYKGKAPPELKAGPGHWINEKKPLSLKGLKGKVVYLEFGFLH